MLPAEDVEHCPFGVRCKVNDPDAGVEGDRVDLSKPLNDKRVMGILRSYQIYYRFNTDLLIFRALEEGDNENRNFRERFFTVYFRSNSEGLPPTLSLKPTFKPRLDANWRDSLCWLNPARLIDSSGPGARGHLLKPGDLVRFGACALLVLETCVAGDNKRLRTLHRDREPGLKRLLYNGDTPHIRGKVCQLCLVGDQSPPEKAEPLMDLCGCSRGVHVDCFSHWTDGRLKVQRTEKAVSLQIKDFSCPVCGEPYPRRVTCRGVLQNIVNFEAPGESFVTFELFNLSKPKFLHVFSLKAETGGTVSLGRRSDLVTAHTSAVLRGVAEVHATIGFRNGVCELFNEDRQSGTAVVVRRRLPVTHNLLVLYGHILFQFCVNEPKKPVVLDDSALPDDEDEDSGSLM